MTTTEATKEFDKALNELSYSGESYHNLFTKVIDCTIVNMLIQDDCNVFGKIELKREEIEPMQRAMIALGEVMHNDGKGLHDVLGDLFMDNISHGHNGQYFSPQTICDMIAQMQIKDTRDGLSIADSTGCGSGRMLLAAAKINRNFNLYGCDNNLLCCKMATLNLALNNLRGEILWGNPLSLEVYASFRISRDFLTGFPIVRILKDSVQFPVIKEMKKAKVFN